MDGDPNDPSAADAAPAGKTADPSIGPPESAAGTPSSDDEGADGTPPDATGSSSKSPNQGMTLGQQLDAYGAGRAIAEKSVGVGPGADGYDHTDGQVHESVPSPGFIDSVITFGKTVLGVLGIFSGNAPAVLSGGLSIAQMGRSGSFATFGSNGMGKGATGIMSGASPGSSTDTFGGSSVISGNPPSTFGGGPDYSSVASSPVTGYGGIQVNTPKAYGPNNSGFLPGTILALNSEPAQSRGVDYSYAAKLSQPGPAIQPGSAAGGIDIQTALAVAIGAAIIFR